MDKNVIQREGLKVLEYAKSLSGQIESLLLQDKLKKTEQRRLSKLAHEHRRVAEELVKKLKAFKPYEPNK